MRHLPVFWRSAPAHLSRSGSARVACGAGPASRTDISTWTADSSPAIGTISSICCATRRSARDDNPLSQITDWRDLDAGSLLIATSTEHLAQRLGRALEKAYHGKVHYGFSHENKMAHVWWHR
jgi:hypothetical protein